MGERIVIRATKGLTPVVSLAAILLLAGCSSTGKRSTPRAPSATDSSAPASATQVRRPAEIRSMDLVSEGSGASLELVADRPLVWTSFRDASGDLVIELPNSVPGADVLAFQRTDGLVSSVDVELLDDADRPLTRLVVQTTEPSEHSLGGEGETLRLQLSPVDSGTAVALAYEPVEDEDVVEASEVAAVPTPSYSAPPPAPDAVRPAHGTADAPQSGPPPTGVVASRLDAVEVVDQGSSTVVLVRGDGEFEYSTFRLENPERFVIDLVGVVNTASRTSTSVDGPLLEQVRIGQFKPRPAPVARVVFDLLSPNVPWIQRSADGLTVTFGDGAPSGSVATTLAQDVGAVDSEPAMDDPADSSTVVYEAPQEATDTLAASQPTTADTMGSTGDTMAVDDEPMETEVADVAPAYTPPPAYEPPPTTVATYQPPPPPQRTPAVAQPVQGTQDVSLFEAQEVQVEAPEEEEDPILASFGALVVSRQEREYVGDPIDMSLKKADLVETLRSFATISDLNFVIQPGVSGSVTVELKGVPWDQAMEQILKINNLGMDIDGTIVRIAPMSQLRAEAEEQRRLAQSRQQSVPLRTVMKSLSYSSADELATLLQNRTGSILSSRGTVQVDRRTNTLIIRELPENVDVVLAVIDNLDAPEPQVTIEARIIEATKSFSRSLGIQWGYAYDANQTNGNTTGLSFPSSVDLDGSVSLLTGGSTGLLTLSLGNILDSFTLDAQLQVAENEGLVNLVSAPRITTLNNTSASIQSGVQIPIQTVSNNTVSVQFVNATLQLTVTPQVTAEGTILMDVQVAKRSPQPGLAIIGSTNAPISTRDARTTVIVRDGGTAVIGGIYEVSSNQVQDRLPGLANIPILGHLFKNRNRSNSNDELMIFITPRIVQM